MDTITTIIMNVLHTQIVGGFHVSHFLILLIGSLLPVVIGLVLPRKHTVQYGIALDKFLGLALLQKRIFGENIPSNIIGGIVQAVRTTFQDLSFGVYIDSRKDLTEEQRKQKIEEYLGTTTTTPPPKKDSV